MAARAFALMLVAALATACTTRPLAPEAETARRGSPLLFGVEHALAPPPFDPAAFRVSPGPRTVEDHLVLRAYDRVRPPDYTAFRVEFRGTGGSEGRAHFLVPPGPGPHPGLLVLPILGGSHVVSEAAAKALVRRGYAVLRVERHRLFPPTDAPQDEWDRVPINRPAERLAEGLRDGRRLIDWLERRPEVDPERLGVVGVSIGGIMAATLMGLDERLRAGVFVMAGGDLPGILLHSTERPLVRFREVHCGDCDPEEFRRRLGRHTRPFDPLTWAGRIAPAQVLLVSGRWDAVVPPESTEALWEALGRPRWHRYPGGHYTIAPFFWWAMGRGADHLDRALAPAGDAGAAVSAPSAPAAPSTRSPSSSSRSTTRSPASRPGEKPRS